MAPQDPECFGFLAEAEIGPADSEGAELFQLQVCTPTWFKRWMQGTAVVSGEHTLFMSHYDYRALIAYLERRCRSCEGTTWADVVDKLKTLGGWEFDGSRSAPSG